MESGEELAYLCRKRGHVILADIDKTGAKTVLR